LNTAENSLLPQVDEHEDDLLEARTGVPPLVETT
jgi:hypothetical protein